MEERKNNIYYDKTGTQILVGDLLKVFHFKVGKRTYYMYQVAVMEETKDFPVMALRSYNEQEPHYRIYVVATNRICESMKIINRLDFQTKRKKLVINN